MQQSLYKYSGANFVILLAFIQREVISINEIIKKWHLPEPKPNYFLDIFLYIFRTVFGIYLLLVVGFLNQYNL